MSKTYKKVFENKAQSINYWNKLRKNEEIVKCVHYFCSEGWVCEWNYRR